MSGYTVEKELFIEELQCHLTQLRHTCGARVLHLGNDDPENVFCLSFRTLPESSSGVAHILEHTVLCGSKKYPVKDPFFSMIRRSLNTFMNAMTGDDMTFYPAASQVRQDFYNLLDVYLDAVFFPQLRQMSFEQEGHRLEFDTSGKLQYKGIVFNEMKGAMASPDARAWQSMAEALYPDTPYRFNSGGDPAHIPDLTYEELLSFHKKFYSPSRCLFYFYGNLPLQGHLDFLETHLLHQASSEKPLPPTPTQPRFKHPRFLEGTYPISPDDPTEDKEMVLLGWLTCSPKEPLIALKLQVVDLILMGSDAAPLKLALLKSGLCKEVYSMIDPDAADVSLVLICKGCSAGSAKKIEALVLKEVERIASEGVADELIAGAIHQLEFGRTEITGDSYPFGLNLFRRTVPLILAGGEAEDGLRIHHLFEQLRSSFNVQQELQELLLKNQHRVCLLMQPDASQADREIQEERNRLDALCARLSDKEKKKIREEATALVEDQEALEEGAIDVLPKIKLSDVPKEAVNFKLKSSSSKTCQIHHHSCFTNHILDAAYLFDLPQLKEEEIPLVRLLLSFLPEVGCGGRNYQENLEVLQLYTADVNAGVATYPYSDNPQRISPAINLEGKALSRNASKLLPLLLEMGTTADFTDLPRLQELLMQHYSAIEHGIVHHAMSYALNLASAGLSQSAAFTNRSHGLEYLHFCRSLVAEETMETLAQKLSDCQAKFLCRGKAELLLSCDDQIKTGLQIPAVPFKEGTSWNQPLQLPKNTSQGRIIASPVAFTAKALSMVPYTHPDAPLLALAARLFNHKVLHQEIREKGGAYGGGAKANVNEGTFHFYAYRDPHLKSSLAAMDLSVEKIGAGQFSPSDLEEAKLSILQKLDSPVSPGSRAYVAWVREREGRTLQARQQFRDALLQATSQEVVRAILDHIAPKMSTATVVVFASKEFLERENAGLSSPLPLEKA
ncbi:MAG: insulinase family protein [Verrucomicrobia bacterium]|nr:insulinase family protein [Verrucomicrobiota bacterium]